MTSFSQSLKDIAVKRGRIELLTNLLGYQALRTHSERQKKNLAAEDHAARVALGWTGAAEVDAEAEMGDTILGDVNHVPAAPPRRSVLSSLALAALGASVPGAAIGGYFVSRLFPDDSVVAADESVRIRLPDPGRESK